VAHQIVVISAVVLLALLALREFAGGGASMDTVIGVSGQTWCRIAGWVGIWTGLTATYVATAHLWNECFGRVVLPIVPYRAKAAVTAENPREQEVAAETE
jgi:succinate-acetate transporter protein